MDNIFILIKHDFAVDFPQRCMKKCSNLIISPAKTHFTIPGKASIVVQIN
jgi:hypothetical protein